MSTYKPFYDDPTYLVGNIPVGSPESAQYAIDTANRRASSAPPSGGASALLYNPQTNEYAFGEQVLGRLGAKDLQTVAYEATRVGGYNGPRPAGFVSIDHNRLLTDLSVAEQNPEGDSGAFIANAKQATGAAVSSIGAWLGDSKMENPYAGAAAEHQISQPWNEQFSYTEGRPENLAQLYTNVMSGAGQVAPTLAGALVGGTPVALVASFLTNSGQQADAARDVLVQGMKGMSDSELMQSSPAYAEARRSGMNEQDAITATLDIARRRGAMVGGVEATIETILGAKLVSTIFGKSLMGGKFFGPAKPFTTAIPTSFTGRVAKGAAFGGLEEGVGAAAGDYAVNERAMDVIGKDSTFTAQDATNSFWQEAPLGFIGGAIGGGGAKSRVADTDFGQLGNPQPTDAGGTPAWTAGLGAMPESQWRSPSGMAGMETPAMVRNGIPTERPLTSAVPPIPNGPEAPSLIRRGGVGTYDLTPEPEWPASVGPQPPQPPAPPSAPPPAPPAGGGVGPSGPSTAPTGGVAPAPAPPAAPTGPSSPEQNQVELPAIAKYFNDTVLPVVRAKEVELGIGQGAPEQATIPAEVMSASQAIASVRAALKNGLLTEDQAAEAIITIDGMAQTPSVEDLTASGATAAGQMLGAVSAPETAPAPAAEVPAVGKKGKQVKEKAKGKQVAPAAVQPPTDAVPPPAPAETSPEAVATQIGDYVRNANAQRKAVPDQVQRAIWQFITKNPEQGVRLAKEFINEDTAAVFGSPIFELAMPNDGSKGYQPAIDLLHSLALSNAKTAPWARRGLERSNLSGLLNKPAPTEVSETIAPTEAEQGAAMAETQPENVKPEGAPSVAAQVKEVIAGRKKAALVVPADKPAGKLPPKAQAAVDTAKLSTAETPQGTVVTKGKQKAAEVQAKADKGKMTDAEMAKTLGYDLKKAKSDGSVVIVESKDGTEVLHEELTTAAKVEALADKLTTQYSKGLPDNEKPVVLYGVGRAGLDMALERRSKRTANAERIARAQEREAAKAERKAEREALAAAQQKAFNDAAEAARKEAAAKNKGKAKVKEVQSKRTAPADSQLAAALERTALTKLRETARSIFLSAKITDKAVLKRLSEVSTIAEIKALYREAKGGLREMAPESIAKLQSATRAAVEGENGVGKPLTTTTTPAPASTKQTTSTSGTPTNGQTPTPTAAGSRSRARPSIRRDAAVYAIVDTATGKEVGYATTRRSARIVLDRRDNAVGGYRHRIVVLKPDIAEAQRKSAEEARARPSVVSLTRRLGLNRSAIMSRIAAIGPKYGLTQENIDQLRDLELAATVDSLTSEATPVFDENGNKQGEIKMGAGASLMGTGARDLARNQTILELGLPEDVDAALEAMKEFGFEWLSVSNIFTAVVRRVGRDVANKVYYPAMDKAKAELRAVFQSELDSFVDAFDTTPAPLSATERMKRNAQKVEQDKKEREQDQARLDELNNDKTLTSLAYEWSEMDPDFGAWVMGDLNPDERAEAIAEWEADRSGRLARYQQERANLIAERDALRKKLGVASPQRREPNSAPSPSLRTSAQSTGTRVADLTKAVADYLKRLGDNAPDVTVLATPEDLPQSIKDASPDYAMWEGAYDPATGKVYLIASNIEAGDVPRLLVHEIIGHFGVENVVGEAGWQEIEADVAELAKSGKYAEFFNQLDEDYPLGEYSVRERAMEAVARIAELQPDAGVVQKVINFIKRALSALKITAYNHQIQENLPESIRRALSDSREFVRSGDRGQRVYAERRASPSLNAAARQVVKSDTYTKVAAAGRKVAGSNVVQTVWRTMHNVATARDMQDYYGDDTKWGTAFSKTIDLMFRKNAFINNELAKLAEATRHYNALNKAKRLAVRQLMLDTQKHNLNPNVPLDKHSWLSKTQRGKPDVIAAHQRLKADYDALGDVGRQAFDGLAARNRQVAIDYIKARMAIYDTMLSKGTNNGGLPESIANPALAALEDDLKQVEAGNLNFSTQRAGDWLVVVPHYGSDGILLGEFGTEAEADEELADIRARTPYTKADKKKVGGVWEIRLNEPALYTFDSRSEAEAAIADIREEVYQDLLRNFNGDVAKANEAISKLWETPSPDDPSILMPNVVAKPRNETYGENTFGSFTPEQVKRLNDLLRKKEITMEGYQLLMEDYLKSSESTSVTLSRLRRKLVRGATEADMLDAYVRRYTSMVHALAGAKVHSEEAGLRNDLHSDALQKSYMFKTGKDPVTGLNALQTHEDATATMLKRGAANLFYQSVRGLTTFLNLALSPAYAMMNITQPHMLGVPWLASQVVNGQQVSFAEATSAVTESLFSIDAYRRLAEEIAVGLKSDAGVIAGKTISREQFTTQAITDIVETWAHGMTPADKAAFLDLVLGKENLMGDREGGLMEQDALALSYTDSVYDAMNTTQIGDAVKRIERMSMSLGKLTEIGNRLTMARASFRIAKNKGMAQDEMLSFVSQSIYRSQGDFSRTNRAAVFNHPFWGTAFQFKTYVQLVYGLFARNAYTALNINATPAQRKAAWRMLGGMLSTHSLMAGATGLGPFGVALKAVMVMVGFGASDDDEQDEFLSTDAIWRRGLREMLDDPSGESMLFAMLTNGIPAAVLDVDAAERIAIPKLVDTRFIRVDPDNESQSFLNGVLAQSIGGAPYSTAVRLFDGASMFVDGVGDGNTRDMYLGLAKVLPQLPSNIIKASDKELRGVIDQSGRDIIAADEIKAGDILTNIMGFRTYSETSTQRDRGDFFQTKTAITERRNDLLKQAARARGDDAVRIRETIADFNKQVPDELRITPRVLLNSKVQRNKGDNSDDAAIRALVEGQ